MSLLDDVSIVVTPNGYKAGTLYGVIPVPTEGTELIVDSSFANDLDDWTPYGIASATGGIATIGANANSGIYQEILTEGVRYTVTVNVTSYDGVGTAEFANNNGTNIYTITETGIQTFTFVHDIASSVFILRGRSNALLSVSSVSVKEYTAADMDVTRETAATRVDEDGLVNYAEIIGSEEVTNGDFATDSDWTLGTGWSISNGKLIGNNATGYALQGGVFESGVSKIYKITLTVSDYVSGYFTILTSGGTSQSQQFNSNGDYTIYFNTNSPSGTTLHFTYFGSFTGSIDNVSVKEAARDNVPRIDYTGGGCPHILAEGQRTNLMLYSEDFSSNWTTSNLSVVEHSTTSPSGETNADKLKEDSSNSSHTIRYASPNTPVTNGAVYTMSFFAKKAERTSIRFSNAAMSNTYGQFNLSNGQVISSGSSATNSMVDYGNGWYRCIMTFTSTTTIAQANIAILNANNDITYQGDGSSGLYMWGVQIEAGSYETSYISTSGSTVTRNQDIFTRDGIGSLINDSEGVLFSEVYFEQTGLTNGLFAISDGTFNNILMVRYSPINKLQIESTGGVNIIESSARPSGTYKIAVKYDSNGVELWVDGNKISETSTQSTMSGINELMLGKSPYGNIVGCKVKQLQVYNTALTDAQLTSLTS